LLVIIFKNHLKLCFFSGLRKPDKRVYLEATRQLKVDPTHCIFIDDRSKNVEAAVEVGMVGIVFQDAKQVERELAGFGYVF
jgi:HAD superfamily hydrolase (TIGR01509 family)